MRASPLDPQTGQVPTGATSEAWGRVSGRADELERGLLKSIEGLGNLEAAGRYHLLGGGKRLRGRLALAAGLGLGCPFPHALKIAVSVELLHNASLVHDDLQDADWNRRGRPAVWAKFEKSTALLVGDVLIAKAFCALSELSSPRSSELIQELAACVLGLASGQSSDKESAGAADGSRLERSVEAYERLAKAKTGWLFSLPAALVCIHMHGRGPMVEASKEAFAWLGVAFQIFDDIVDLTAGKGRDVGSDLRCDRLSAAVLHAELASGAVEAAGEGLTIDERAQLILTGPGMASALEHQRRVVGQAIEASSTLPPELGGVLRDAAAEIQVATERVIAAAQPRGSVSQVPDPRDPDNQDLDPANAARIEPRGNPASRPPLRPDFHRS